MIQGSKAQRTTPKQPFFIFLTFFGPSREKGLIPKALPFRPLPFSRKKEIFFLHKQKMKSGHQKSCQKSLLKFIQGPLVCHLRSSLALESQLRASEIHFFDMQTDIENDALSPPEYFPPIGSAHAAFKNE